MREIHKLTIIVVISEILIGFIISTLIYMIFTLGGKSPGFYGWLLGWIAFTSIGLLWKYWELEEWKR